MGSVRKRRWTNNGALKSVWIADYHDGGGVRRQKSFATKRDADAFLTTTAWELRQGIHTAETQSVTVDRAGAMWIERARNEGLEPTTIESYDAVFRLHISPLLGNRKLSQLTAPLIEAFRDELLETRSRQRAERALSELRMILNYAQRRGFVAQNVAANVIIRRSGRHRKEAVIPTKEELNAFLDAADGSGNLQTQVFANLLVFTGLRASEIRGLPWRAINLQNGTVTVLQRADRKNVIGPPKSKAGFRTIPLTSSLVRLLETWKSKTNSGALDLVFAKEPGCPFTYDQIIGELFDPLMIAAKLAVRTVRGGRRVVDHKYSLHNFRHASASLWIASGAQPKRVQYWMGHESIQMTFDLYGHLFEQHQADAKLMRNIERDLRGAARRRH